MFKKIRNTKKANIAPMLTLGYVFISLLWYIILFSFANDSINPQNIGSNGDFNSLDVNNSVDTSYLSSVNVSWTDKFWMTIDGLPFWLKLFISTPP